MIGEPERKNGPPSGGLAWLEERLEALGPKVDILAQDIHKITTWFKGGEVEYDPVEETPDEGTGYIERMAFLMRGIEREIVRAGEAMKFLNEHCDTRPYPKNKN